MGLAPESRAFKASPTNITRVKSYSWLANLRSCATLGQENMADVPPSWWKGQFSKKVQQAHTQGMKKKPNTEDAGFLPTIELESWRGTDSASLLFLGKALLRTPSSCDILYHVCKSLFPNYPPLSEMHEDWRLETQTLKNVPTVKRGWSETKCLEFKENI